jgi:hypothetical protein
MVGYEDQGKVVPPQERAMRRLVREPTKRIVPGQSSDLRAKAGWRGRWGVWKKKATRMKLRPAKGRQIL